MMPDTPVEPTPSSPYDPRMEQRVTRLESDVRDIQTTLARLEAMLEATLPHLATKADVAQLRAELAEKPSRAYMWGVLAALVTAYAAGLAALAILK